MPCLFHKWNGCKCLKCGKIRDKHHNWNGCMCVQCSKKRNEQHDWNGNVCKLCGKNKVLIDKIKEFGAKRLPFLHLEKKENMTYLALSIFLVVMFVFHGIMATLETNSNKNNETHMHTSSSVSENVNNLDVADELHEVTPSPTSYPVKMPETQEQTKPSLTPEPIEKQLDPTPTSESVAENDASTAAQPHTPTPSLDSKPQSSQSTIVYVGHTGNKYHKQNCRTLKNGAIETTLENVLSQGRDPCRVCY